MGRYAPHWYGGLVRCAKLSTNSSGFKNSFLLTVSVCDTSNWSIYSLASTQKEYTHLVLFPILMSSSVLGGLKQILQDLGTLQLHYQVG